MPTYDFKSLSSYDFEGLIRDLLQEELGLTLQSFKIGRDKGIDLRFSGNSGKDLIVQCKHYAESPYSAFYHHIKEEELRKIEILKPKRYILATSLGLTPHNKDELHELLKPFCRSTADILGKEDLNNLLGKFPRVEKKNFKLWLTSQNVLDAILHSKVLNRTDFEVDYIQRKLKYYVQNKSYFEAIEILEEFHYCVIAGIPGIGKTTLAEILVVDYLSKGFEPIKISHHIEEAFEVFNPMKTQLFYYDDFLGQTTFEQKMDKNEDQDLIRFCEVIQKSPNHRFILTTREYILNKAKLSYEKLAQSQFDLRKCVIDLSSYSTFDRAKILYNHLFFSDLPINYKKEILSQKSYWKIIRHRNYNPRIIEWMTDHIKNIALDGVKYIDVFLANLENPEKIWTHAFQNQLSESSRCLLLVLGSLPDEVFIDDLENAFSSYYEVKAERHRFRTSPQDFRRALKELEGNFIRIERSASDTVIRFHNPSIKDFVYNYLSSNLDEVKLLCSASVFFDQLRILWQLNRKNIRDALMGFADEFMENLKRNLHSKDVILVNAYYGFSGKTSSFAHKRRITTSLESRIVFAVEVAESIKKEELCTIIAQMLQILAEDLEKMTITKNDTLVLIEVLAKSEYKYLLDKSGFLQLAKEALKSNLEELKDFKYVVSLRKLEPELFSSDEWQELSDYFENHHYQIATSYIDGEEYSEDVSDYGELVYELGKEFEVDVSFAESYIEDRVQELEEEEKNHQEPVFEDDRHGSGPIENISDDQIDSMFDSYKIP